MKTLRRVFLSVVAAAMMLASTRTVISGPNNDADAGAWQMIVLTSPTQFSVPAPLSTTSSNYQSELQAIRSAQSQLTDAQRKSIQYWSKGAVVRWNEILIEFVARADLPPAPRADGTYPVPDANNPFADPNFPFGNPPYAARAYSYVSVAQFEALKAAWYYKYLYNRPSPSKIDTSIQALIPSNDLPAYPSEDAVLSGVSVALLKLLFPVSAGEIDAKVQRAVAGGHAVGQSGGQRHPGRSCARSGHRSGVHHACESGRHGYGWRQRGDLAVAD